MMSDEKCYVLIKRGLYWGPNFRGYTGDIRRAGRYTLAEASEREYPKDPTRRKTCNPDEVVSKRLIKDEPEGKAMLKQEAELATLRAKSEAWDKGVERLAVYNGKGDFMWTDNYLEKPQNADLPVGCHYRKVKVCEVVE